MKTAILVSIVLDLIFLVSAVVIFKGKGDWMISNYRSLPEEKKARINIGRLRIVMAIMLVFMAVEMPFNLLAKSELQHIVGSVIVGVGLLASLLVAHFWAGYPFFVNPFKK